MKRKRRRAVTGFFALVLLGLGGALLYYSISVRGGLEDLFSTTVEIKQTPVSAEQQNGRGRDFPASPIPAAPAPTETDFLPLLTTVTGLISSVAGIVSAIYSVRPVRVRQ